MFLVLSIIFGLLACVLLGTMSTNGYPMSQSISNYIRVRRGTGVAGDSDLLTRTCPIWHRVNYPVSGTTMLTFFNEARAPGVTNMQTPNVLPANYGYVFDKLRVHVLPGFDRMGLRLGMATPGATGSAASSLNWGQSEVAGADYLGPVWKWHESMRALLQQGEVTFNLSDRPLFTCYGLDKFPAGRGVVSSFALSDAASNDNGTGTSTLTIATSHALTTISNGMPFPGAAFAFREPQAIAACQQFSLTINWQTGINFADQYVGPLYVGGMSPGPLPGAVTACVIMVELDGEFVQQANA